MTKLFLIFLLLLSSCANLSNKESGENCDIDIEQFSTSETLDNDKKLYITSSREGFSKDDLEDARYLAYVTSMFKLLGFDIVDNENDASYSVIYNYGISNPETRFSQSIVPITTYEPGKTSTIYGSNGLYATVRTQGTTSTSYSTVTSQITLYSRGIVIALYKKENKLNKMKMIWKTNIDSVGTSKDFQKIFPIMLIPSINNFNAETKNIVRFRINESNELVSVLKGILPIERGVEILKTRKVEIETLNSEEQNKRICSHFERVIGSTRCKK